MKKNKKVKMTFNVAPEVRRRIKNLVEELGYKSESAFCGEAIEEYLSKLQYDSIGTYMNKLLVQAVDCTIAGHTDRVADMLFKLAVSIEKQNLIASGEYDDYYESYIEEVAIENVQKRRGRL
ncbi:MAG: hypothetical protein IKB93_12665 [Clostridia bacterium]|nr:hypothetical protein [Clostridia bacterium]